VVLPQATLPLQLLITIEFVGDEMDGATIDMLNPTPIHKVKTARNTILIYTLDLDGQKPVYRYHHTEEGAPPSYLNLHEGATNEEE
jgi:hypothetical protein